MRIPYQRLFLLLMLFGIGFSASAQMLLRTPAISPDGSKMAFSYQGDIWVSAPDGTNPRRLTIHEAYERGPVWSPDGKQIAFTGNRFGNSDIFTVSADGGTPKRLTFHATRDNSPTWTNDNSLLFMTRRSYAQIERESEVYKISADGGTPFRFSDAYALGAVASPDGKLIAMEKGYCRTAREDYRGTANRDIWIYNTETKAFNQLTTFNGNDWMPVWGTNRTLYFISAKSGKYNVHQQKVTDDGKASGEAKMITNFKDFGVHYLSTNGKTVLVEKMGDIYSVPASGGSAKKLNISFGADYRFDPYEYKTYSNNLESYDVSPDGKHISFIVHGELFVKKADKEKSSSINISSHPYRERQSVWLNDSTVIFVSDREGNNEFYLARSSDNTQSNLTKTLKRDLVRLTNTSENEFMPTISPNGKRIAFRRGLGYGKNKLIVADIDSTGKMSNEKVLKDSWQSADDVVWSPDSKWLAYSMANLNFNSEIYIQSADDGEPVNVSMHPRGDYQPSWSADGKKLAFVSARNNSDYDVWFVWLNKADWEKTKDDWDYEKDDEANDKKDKKKKEDKEVEPIQIDFDRIYMRLQQVTSMPGGESEPVFSEDGELIYFTMQNNTSTKSDLFSVKWDGTEVKAVTKGGKNPRALTSKDGKVYFSSAGVLHEVNTKGNKLTRLPHSAKMKLDYEQENKQIFDEAWQSLNQGFYDPDFHGQDFDKLRKQYEPMALKATTGPDFRYIFNLMLGRLNASHMGLYGGDRAETQRESVGMLGIEVKPATNGVEIMKIVAGTPADRTSSKLQIGEVITAVNGMPIGATTNFHSLLINMENERNLLEVTASNGTKKEVIIRPARSIRTELYEEWVSDKKALVDRYSNGTLGYIHIQGMNMPSFERFERELTASGMGKEGIVIDVRFNGGGWTTDYLMTVLSVKQHAFTIPRGAAKDLEKEKDKFKQYYPYGERLPFAAWVKPAVTICNEFSYSNAEIFSHAFKNLGRGKLVGKSTFGAVISTGANRLMDGSRVRMPFRGWYSSATGENMDMKPAVPNVIVENPPAYKATGEDPQLKKAVEELLKETK
ncbi:MAG: tricorn protease [Bacteroidia bacterium]|jgi:tricorn protease